MDDKKRDRALQGILIGIAVLAVFFVAAVLAVRAFLDAGRVEEAINAELAGASDAGYRVDIGALRFSLIGRSVTFEDVVLSPDAARARAAPRRAKHPSVQLTLPAVHLEGVALWPLLRDGTLRLARLRIPQAQARLTFPVGADSASSTQEPPSRSRHARIASAMPPLYIGRLELEDGSVTFAWENAPQRPEERINDVSFVLQGVAVDSLSARDATRALFSDDVAVRFGAYTHHLADSLYVVEVGPVEASSSRATLHIGGVRYEPFGSDAAFARRVQYRKDRLRIGSDGITATGVDFRRLLEEGAFVAEAMHIDSFVVDVYGDKRLPEGPQRTPRMPHETFQSMNLPIRIDTLRVTGPSIRYTERAPESARPGTIVFDDVEATLYHLVNRSRLADEFSTAVIDARCRLQGRSVLTAHFEYPLLAPGLNLTYRGGLASMEAAAFNDMLVNLEGLRITSGHVDTLWYDVDVRNASASGALQVLYRDLSMETLDKKTGGKNLVNELKSFVANNFVIKPKNIGGEGEPPTVALIDVTKKPNDPFFKFLWITVREGLLETIK